MLSSAGYLDVATSETLEPRALARGSWRRPAAVASIALGGVAAYALVAARASPSTMARSERLQGLREFSGSASSASAQLIGLKPLEYMHDGNICDVNEELYGGLCYKKCSALTSWKAPIRTSPWTCCEQHPCTPMNEEGKIGLKIMCTGFDIGGNGGCPHKPGACLVDEELYGGICYEKCNQLTNGAFPNRVGPATCCDEHGLGCLSPEHGRTDKAFDVGGGEGDHDPSTLATAHLPQLSLTEDESADEEATTTTPVAPVRMALKPLEVMDDGNVCADTEEFYGGLCYKRCALLTGGEASIRTSSWTCCRQHPCVPWKQVGSLGSKILCNGFDISGDGGCPHKPGACLLDEELYMGVCYKRCSLLTQGQYPHRTAAATCCKTTGLACLYAGNDRTNRDFDVGGGAGDGDASTPAEPHPPLQSLTEGDTAPPSSAGLPRRLRAA